MGAREWTGQHRKEWRSRVSGCWGCTLEHSSKTRLLGGQGGTWEGIPCPLEQRHPGLRLQWGVAQIVFIVVVILQDFRSLFKLILVVRNVSNYINCLDDGTDLPHFLLHKYVTCYIIPLLYHIITHQPNIMIILSSYSSVACFSYCAVGNVTKEECDVILPDRLERNDMYFHQTAVISKIA